MNVYLAILFVLVSLTLVLSLVRTARRIRIGRNLSVATRPFEHESGPRSLLVIGDSTAVGVGADDPATSVAGRLGILLDASVENHARSGAIVADLSAQLALAKRARYDMVLIQCGGNDIIKLHPLGASCEAMDNVLGAARTKSDRVALLTAGRIGHAPFFPRMIAPLFTARSLRLRDLFSSLAQKHGILYVDLLGMSKVLNADTEHNYAADLLHLSGAGYGIWFGRLKTEMEARWPELF